MHELLKPDAYVTVTCNDGSTSKGYVVALHRDDFEFGIVTNAFEHFSNISAPAELSIRRIRFADVADVSA